LITLVQSSVRFELLDADKLVFAKAHFWQSMIRTFLAQVGGLVADSAYRESTFRVMDLSLLVAILSAVSLFSVEPVSLLVVLNLLVAVALPVTMPVLKALTFDVASSKQEIMMMNSWELTIEKIVRYAAPFIAAYLLYYVGFTYLLFIVQLGLLFSAVGKTYINLAKAVKASDKEHVDLDELEKNQINRKPAQQTSADRLPRQTLILRLLEGFKLLGRSDLRIAPIHTILNNTVIFPFFSIAFPILCKQIDPQHWKDITSFVNLGGILGPVLSQMFLVSNLSPKSESDGLKLAIKAEGYLSVLLLLALIASFQIQSKLFTTAANFILLALLTASQNLFTVYFSGYSQSKLQKDQRGRFLANLMTLANLAHAGGSMIYFGDHVFLAAILVIISHSIAAIVVATKI
jgi:hypothetical protein